ncbi:hypothetical protein C882_3647 [Caenispirillum salinarum AK4]|uniref:Uncharacterized protein n=1 Tax=Caenispirillum salinarum AK4 TaxID=1238182 RepID=K9GZ79_9PROT|nr:hypothetical protein C882_3647 [Caenispirillum salinarum AK4]
MAPPWRFAAHNASGVAEADASHIRAAPRVLGLPHKRNPPVRGGFAAAETLMKIPPGRLGYLNELSLTQGPARKTLSENMP